MEQLRWDEKRELAPTLSIEAVPAGRTLVWRNNAYVLSSGPTRVFFGGEIDDVGLLERYRTRDPAVSVALLAGQRAAACSRATARDGVEGGGGGRERAGCACARSRPRRPRRRPALPDLQPSRVGDAKALAATASSGLEVVCLPPGERWEYEAPAPRG